MTNRLSMVTMANEKSKDQRIAGMVLIIIAVMLFFMATTSHAAIFKGVIIDINADSTMVVDIMGKLYIVHCTAYQKQLIRDGFFKISDIIDVSLSIINQKVIIRLL